MYSADEIEQLLKDEEISKRSCLLCSALAPVGADLDVDPSLSDDDFMDVIPLESLYAPFHSQFPDVTKMEFFKRWEWAKKESANWNAVYNDKGAVVGLLRKKG